MVIDLLLYILLFSLASMEKLSKFYVPGTSKDFIYLIDQLIMMRKQCSSCFKNNPFLLKHFFLTSVTTTPAGAIVPDSIVIDLVFKFSNYPTKPNTSKIWQGKEATINWKDRLYTGKKSEKTPLYVKWEVGGIMMK